MRVVHAQGYHEPRDALSQDWFPFLAACNITPILVPNIGENAEAFVADMNVTGVLLTGGNNVCPQSYGGAPEDTVNDMAPERDKTETALINFALQNNLPILGVCRGMHMLNAYFGGKILTSIKEQVPSCGNHVACQHHVDISSSWLAAEFSVNDLRVNSYHDQGFTIAQLAPSLECVAHSEPDGVVEALAHPEFPIFGIQWHPERQGSAIDFDKALVNRFLVEKTFNPSQSRAERA